MKLRQLTEDEKASIWADVRSEFPDDPMMQEIHFVQYVRYEQTKELSTEDWLLYYNQREAEEHTVVPPAALKAS